MPLSQKDFWGHHKFPCQPGMLSAPWNKITKQGHQAWYWPYIQDGGVSGRLYNLMALWCLCIPASAALYQTALKLLQQRRFKSRLLSRAMTTHDVYMWTLYSPPLFIFSWLLQFILGQSWQLQLCHLASTISGSRYSQHLQLWPQIKSIGSLPGSSKLSFVRCLARCLPHKDLGCKN